MSKGKNHSNPFGGFFDFNGDGRTDIGEQFLAYKVFNEIMKEPEENEADDSDDNGFTDFFR